MKVRLSHRSALLLALAFMMPAISVSASTHEVGAHQKFSTIQQALSSANPYDTVVVNQGLYKEGQLSVEKPLTLIGKGSPVIDGENKYLMLTVKSDYVNISGFIFRNCGFANITDISALRLQGVKYCTVENNTFENNSFGIYQSFCKHCIVRHNHITGTYKAESQSGNGIHNWKCDSLLIMNNDVKGHRDGIYFEFSHQCLVAENTSTGNMRYGLHFMFSDGNTYERNHFEHNGSGVAVMYSNHIIMRENVFDNNWGAAAYGLLLKNINHSAILNNHFIQNTTGVLIEESDGLNVEGNTFRQNGWALKIMSSCTGDSVLKNNFFSNTFDVSTSGMQNNNLFEGNYWDKYRGYDLNHDGKGDVAYRPVSLFSVLMENIPTAVMLLNTIIEDILDAVEKVFPQAIPESLADAQPSMKPNKTSEQRFSGLKDDKISTVRLYPSKSNDHHPKIF